MSWRSFSFLSCSWLSWLLLLLLQHSTTWLVVHQSTWWLSSAWQLDDDTWCLQQWHADRRDAALITFITPSTARTSLVHTLQSLIDQGNPHWLSVVIFDGLLSSSLYLNNATFLPWFYHDLPRHIVLDGRFCFAYLPRSQRRTSTNCAGTVRNIAIQSQVQTEWVGFVDDDDRLLPEYVQYIQQYHLAYPQVGCVWFRMCVHDGKHPPKMIPSMNHTEIQMGEVGISFAMRSILITKGPFLFHSSSAEDLMLLTTLKYSGIPILVSPYVAYSVRGANDAICQTQGQFKLLNNHTEAVSYLQHGQAFPAKKVGRLYPCRQVYSDFQPRFTRPDEIAHVDYSFYPMHGLQAAIRHALQQGCVRRWETQVPVGPKAELQLLSRGDVQQPTSWGYIQLLSNSNSFSATDNTSHLEYALQLWHHHDLSLSEQRELPPTPRYHIPSMLSLDTASPRFRCHSYHSFVQFGQPAIQPFVAIRKHTVFTIYKQGYYFYCRVVDNHANAELVQVEPSRCQHNASTNSYCAKRVVQDFSKATICQQAIQPSKAHEVLMFGTMKHADNNRREQLCDRLWALGIHAWCVQDAGGSLLAHLVCASKVVVMNRYSLQSGLDTVHIDALLQIHKVVIVETSPYLSDVWYEGIVPMASMDRLPALVQHVLVDVHHWMKRHRYVQKAQVFVDSMANNTDPLCFALSRLSDDAAQRSLHHVH